MQSVFSAHRRTLATTCETSASRPESKRQRPHCAGEHSLTSFGPLTATDPQLPDDVGKVFGGFLIRKLPVTGIWRWPAHQPYVETT